MRFFKDVPLLSPPPPQINIIIYICVCISSQARSRVSKKTLRFPCLRHDKVNCDQEVLVLLWKLMEENPVFTQYVLKHCDVNEVGATNEVQYLVLERVFFCRVF